MWVHQAPTNHVHVCYHANMIGICKTRRRWRPRPYLRSAFGQNIFGYVTPTSCRVSYENVVIGNRTRIPIRSREHRRHPHLVRQETTPSLRRGERFSRAPLTERSFKSHTSLSRTIRERASELWVLLHHMPLGNFAWHLRIEPHHCMQTIESSWFRTGRLGHDASNVIASVSRSVSHLKLVPVAARRF